MKLSEFETALQRACELSGSLPFCVDHVPPGEEIGVDPKTGELFFHGCSCYFTLDDVARVFSWCMENDLPRSAVCLELLTGTRVFLHKSRYGLYSWIELCLGGRSVLMGRGLDDLNFSKHLHNAKIRNGLYLDEEDGTLFAANSSARKIVVPEGVTHIHYGAFMNLFPMQEVVLPESLTSIGESAFWGCSNLSSVRLPEHLKLLERNAFNRCGFQHMVIPDSVSVIRDYAFYACSNLQTVVFPKTLQAVDPYAFEHCWKLKTVTIPQGCQCGRNAFPESCEVIRV